LSIGQILAKEKLGSHEKQQAKIKVFKDSSNENKERKTMTYFKPY